ncbi:MAG: hypothetical protein ACLU4J_04265 [Butyricimonas paravirosa]
MCATNAFNDKIMVVASAVTRRGLSDVCSENHIPLLLCIPEDNLEAIWADGPWNDCVKLVCSASGVIILMRFIFLILYARWSFSTGGRG